MTDSNVSSLVPSLRARQDVAAAVRAHMAVRGIKDAELARDLGWSQSYMSRRTNAGTSFSVDDLGVLALHFDLSIAELVQMPTGRPPGGGALLEGLNGIHRVLGKPWSELQITERSLAVVTPLRPRPAEVAPAKSATVTPIRAAR